MNRRPGGRVARGSGAAFRTATVDLPVGDGTRMAAHVARPRSKGPHPGLLLFQEAFGVNGHIRDLAGRFAGEGYVALAPELFHRTAPGFEGNYADFESARGHVQALTVDGLTADARAAHAWLASDPETTGQPAAAVGFCMGGRVAYLADSILPLAAAASFYGGGIAPDLLDRAPALRAPLLICWGGRDSHIPLGPRRAVADTLRGAGKAFIEMEFSEADHGFVCDRRASYHPQAAREAWTLLLSFLDDHARR